MTSPTKAFLFNYEREFSLKGTAPSSKSEQASLGPKVRPSTLFCPAQGTRRFDKDQSIDLANKSGPRAKSKRSIITIPVAAKGSLSRKTLSPLLSRPPYKGPSLKPGSPRPSPIHDWDDSVRANKAKAIALDCKEKLQKTILKLEEFKEAKKNSSAANIQLSGHIQRRLESVSRDPQDEHHLKMLGISPEEHLDTLDEILGETLEEILLEETGELQHGEGHCLARKAVFGGSVVEDSFRRASRSLLADIERFKSQSYRPLNLPEWNGRFVASNLLSQPFRAEKGVVQLNHESFASRMSQFKHNSPATICKSSLRSQNQQQRRPSTSEGRNRQTEPKESSILRAESDKRPSTAPVDSSGYVSGESSVASIDSFQEQGKKDLSHAQIHLNNQLKPLVLCWMIWVDLLERVFAAGEEINYQDLFALSILREPPKCVSDVVGYVCILMGLPPTWRNAKQTVLKEFSIVLNFVRELNPLDIPSQRLFSAKDHKVQVLQEITESSVGSRCESLIPIMRWVERFEEITRVVNLAFTLPTTNQKSSSSMFLSSTLFAAGVVTRRRSTIARASVGSSSGTMSMSLSMAAAMATVTAPAVRDELGLLEVIQQVFPVFRIGAQAVSEKQRRRLWRILEAIARDQDVLKRYSDMSSKVDEMANRLREALEKKDVEESEGQLEGESLEQNHASTTITEDSLASSNILNNKEDSLCEGEREGEREGEEEEEEYGHEEFDNNDEYGSEEFENNDENSPKRESQRDQQRDDENKNENKNENESSEVKKDGLSDYYAQLLDGESESSVNSGFKL